MLYKDVVLLGNDCIIPRNIPEVEIAKIAARVLDEVIQPLRDVQIDDSEFACLRAIVFFDPGTNDSFIFASFEVYYQSS